MKNKGVVAVIDAEQEQQKRREAAVINAEEEQRKARKTPIIVCE